MRTDTFFAARAAIFPMMVLLLWGTPTCVSQTVDGSSAAAIAQQPASPLSQYANPNEVIDFHNRRPGVSLEDGEVVVTKTIDLRNTLQKYAQIKNCSLDQAFSDTVSYLKMQPLQDNDAGRIIGTQAFYSIVEKDKYRITAPRKFFARLEEDLLCLENGKRHVLLDVHFLKVTTTQIENLQTHLVPGSYVAFSNKFPEVIPYATQASIKDSEQWRTQHP